MIHPKDLTLYSLQLVPCTMKCDNVGFINPISKLSLFKIQLATSKWKQHFQRTLRNNLEMGFINSTKVKIKVVG